MPIERVPTPFVYQRRFPFDAREARKIRQAESFLIKLLRSVDISYEIYKCVLFAFLSIMVLLVCLYDAHTFDVQNAGIEVYAVVAVIQAAFLTIAGIAVYGIIQKRPAFIMPLLVTQIVVFFATIFISLIPTWIADIRGILAHSAEVSKSMNPPLSMILPPYIVYFFSLFFKLTIVLSQLVLTSVTSIVIRKMQDMNAAERQALEEAMQEIDAPGPFNSARPSFYIYVRESIFSPPSPSATEEENRQRVTFLPVSSDDEAATMV